MADKKDYLNKCFSPNWVEVDLNSVQNQQKEVIEISQAEYELLHVEDRKDSVENKRRKDLNTLL